MVVNFPLCNTEAGPADMPPAACFGIPKELSFLGDGHQARTTPWTGHFKGPESLDTLKVYVGV